ncbi:hypothetical protein NQ318_018651 [Aromia moschata]|uniref:Essential protein Yae1 N-terminal domain-containing protein n=1 Tax=Aromia moschata TaxID=1265417 RepID=A0AAV8ZFR6_9CUCU|nr:hypothetical protein NQ318_018651 [Aromia moschata]
MEKRENILEIDQTWKRMEDVSKKTGLREGISSGRESNFQEYFDIGYKEGFKNGYALGKCKGALTANSRQRSSELENYSTLDKTRRARCEICKDERLLEENVPEIIKKQKEAGFINSSSALALASA